MRGSSSGFKLLKSASGDFVPIDARIDVVAVAHINVVTLANFLFLKNLGWPHVTLAVTFCLFGAFPLEFSVLIVNQSVTNRFCSVLKKTFCSAEQFTDSNVFSAMKSKNANFWLSDEWKQMIRIIFCNSSVSFYHSQVKLAF